MVSKADSDANKIKKVSIYKTKSICQSYIAAEV